MNSLVDAEVGQALKATLRLCRGVRLGPLDSRDDPAWLIEDRDSGAYFRVGAGEALLIGHLDGRRSIVEAAALATQANPALALDPEGAAMVGEWLIANRLAYRSEEPHPVKAPPSPALASVGQLLTFRIPLCRPDRLMEPASRWLGWFFSAWSTMAVVALIALASCLPLADRPRFAATLQSLFSPWHQAALSLAWVGLKIIHELGHALVCRRYGGRVGQAGVALIMLLPVAFVDVTSSWGFRNRWQRIHTALAGVYVELFVAAVATCVWHCTAPGPINHFAAHLAIMSGVNSVLFNLNPLARLDGYYVFADLLDIPNLYDQAHQAWSAAWQRYVLGIAAPDADHPLRWQRVFRWYGPASWLWRMSTSLTLIIGAAVLFDGLGIVLALIGVYQWFVQPGWKALLALQQQLTQQQRWKRASAVALLGAAALAIVLVLLAPPALRMPAVVEYDPPEPIRAATAGFVQRVCAIDGQPVTAGQPLFELRNDQLTLELARARAAWEKARQEAESAQRAGRLGEFAEKEATIRSLQQRVAQLERSRTELTITAPVAGKFLSRHPETWEGTYVAVGTELGLVGREECKRLRVSVSQDQYRSLTHRQATLLQVETARLPAWSTSHWTLEPKASAAPPHPALSAEHGGPLPVKPAADGGWELVEMRFEATVPLPAAQAQTLLAGQSAIVSVPTNWGARMQAALRHLRNKLLPRD